MTRLCVMLQTMSANVKHIVSANAAMQAHWQQQDQVTMACKRASGSIL